MTLGAATVRLELATRALGRARARHRRAVVEGAPDADDLLLVVYRAELEQEAARAELTHQIEARRAPGGGP